MAVMAVGYSAQITRSILRWTGWLQFSAVLLCALYFFIFASYLQGLAALFGGAIALVNTWLLRWNFERAERIASTSAGANVRMLFSTAAQRLIATIGLFVMGLGALKLPPAAVLTGFLAGVFTLLVARFGFSKLR